ncbi:pickpocket protein 28-like [Rhagoletis pomonella]|uniref:pickpocket protein 28-like n=1 Tax=Rhagoletis pomonella TaxID=28610 RepID=UPI00177AC31E|nr:pickpocket protein 28-like [Rhagoletis pomonella]XP_036344578.1 pickpocket protein 28-like [Rhagoletis pomonella]
MKIYAEDRLVQLKPKFTAEKSKPFARPKEKSSDCSSEEIEFEHLCSKQAAKKSLKYYLQNTTLHGLKYIAEDKITLPERAFFGFAFIAVIILSSYFISNIYMKWSVTPIIISTSAKETLASDVPFPAVTICNLNQASKSKVQGIAEKNLNYSLLMSLCGQNERGEWYNVRGTWRNFKAILNAVAQPCEEMLLYCSFGAKRENCSAIFNSALTDDGLCCTFNALDPYFMLRNYSEDDRISPKSSNHLVPIYWTPERGYAGDLPKNFYPRMPGGTGSRLGLTVVLNSSALEYYCTKSKSIGFKILVHNPAELPRVSNYGFLVTAGREARVPIEPIYENAVPSIRAIHKERRRCLFSDEGDLTYYRTYSRRNCEIECEAKILIDKCDCVLYYLPRINGSARICGPNDNACTNEVLTKIESLDKKLTCSSCWPACFELSYKAMVTATTITPGKFLTFDDLPLDLFSDATNYAEISIVNFYYLSHILRTTTKSEMFGFTDFVSSTGGILGLFMGFSVFSIIEIIYYVTLRPYCASRTVDVSRRRRRHKHMKWLHSIKCRVRPGKYDGSSRFWQNDTEQTKAIKHKNYRNNLNHILLHHKNNQLNNNDDGAQLYPYLE